MSDNYIRVFKQFSLYRQFLQDGPPSHEFDKNELLLRKAQGSNGLARLVAIMANYMSRSSFIKCLPHLEGEEVLGLSSNLLIVILAQMKIPIDLIV
jgi:hypothetical protein